MQCDSPHDLGHKLEWYGRESVRKCYSYCLSSVEGDSHIARSRSLSRLTFQESPLWNGHPIGALSPVSTLDRAPPAAEQRPGSLLNGLKVGGCSRMMFAFWLGMGERLIVARRL